MMESTADEAPAKSDLRARERHGRAAPPPAKARCHISTEFRFRGLGLGFITRNIYNELSFG